MAQGPTVYNAMIMILSSSSAPPRPTPGPTPPGGITPPPSGGGEYPDNTLPGDLPRPEHPIWYPLPPDILPPYIDNTLPPYVDNTLPGSQPRPDNTLPGAQPGIDNTLPGDQPIPSHPIFLPPDNGNGGWLPVYIDNTLPGAGSAGGERPTHPIVLPPDGETDDGAKIKWVCGWTPSTGWVSVAIVVPPEGALVPTPSKAKRK